MMKSFNQTDRNSTVYSLHETQAFYMNIVTFKRLVSESKIKDLLKAFPPVDFDEVGNSIIEHDNLKRTYSKAFLSALNLNYVPNCSREQEYDDPKIKKLRHWIDRAKHNDISITHNFLKFSKLETICITYKYNTRQKKSNEELKPIIRLSNMKENDKKNKVKDKKRNSKFKS